MSRFAADSLLLLFGRPLIVAFIPEKKWIEIESAGQVMNNGSGDHFFEILNPPKITFRNYVTINVREYVAVCYNSRYLRSTLGYSTLMNDEKLLN